MFWNDEKILEWALAGGIEPFDASMINRPDPDTWPGALGGASIDLRLDNLVAEPQQWTEYSTRTLRFGNKDDMAQLWDAPKPYKEFNLRRGKAGLFGTLERVKIPDDACAFLMSRSTTGRCLIEHMHAGFGDPGFRDSTWTLEIINFSAANWVFMPGDRVVQMVVADLNAQARRPYWMKGRYSGQVVPTAPKGWE